MRPLRVVCAVLALVPALAACGTDEPTQGAAGPVSSSSPATATEPSVVPGTSAPPAPGTSPTSPTSPSTTVGTGTGVAPPADGPGAGSWWRPAPGATWQYQLSGVLDTSVPVDVVDADWQETTPTQVAQVHARGGHAVCYVNAGAFEEWRPDAGAYPEDVLGQPLDGWPGERWLDVRRTDVLLPVIAARMDVCRASGFDAVETDNVDGWANDTGFDLTPEDQLVFNRALADLAHARGLGIGLKNDVEQVAELAPVFDFAVNEECAAYDECDAYTAFTDTGKAVLHVEYEGLDAATCALSARLGLSTIGKDLDLGVGLQSC